MKHNVEDVEHFYGQGHDHTHEQHKVKKHAAGHKLNHEYTKEIGHPAMEDHGDTLWGTDGIAGQ